jgi:branched-chain amino acid transport system ATP-binding protein
MGAADVAETLLRIANLTKRFGSLAASDGLSLDVLSGELHAVIGPNGAGKTTLISQLFGEIAPDDGAIWFGGRDIGALSTAERVRIGLARSFQITQLLLDYTALDNVALATQAHRGHSFRFWANARRDRALREQALRTLARVGLDRRADTAVSEMAHGEQKLLELAIALATRPRLLLLDEPMAGLGTAECAATVELLRGLKNETTILLVEHDMDVVFALADRISVLVNGHCVITGTAEDVRNDATVRTAYLGEGDL